METVRLTAGEADLILHRLEGGTLPEVFFDDKDWEIEPAVTERVVDKLIEMARARHVPLAELTDFEREVLGDCFDGSTWLCAATEASECGDEPPQFGAGARRVARSVVAKMRAAGWHDCPDVSE